jgi:hypothetical protein
MVQIKLVNQKLNIFGRNKNRNFFFSQQPLLVSTVTFQTCTSLTPASRTTTAKTSPTPSVGMHLSFVGLTPELENYPLKR